jgi:hypothetical protein
MKLIDALYNENSDKLQQRICLMGESAKDCPRTKADRVEFLSNYLLSSKLNSQLDQMADAEKIILAEVVHNQAGYVNSERLLARYGSLPLGYLQQQPGYWSYSSGRSESTRIKSLFSLILYDACIPTELVDRLTKLLPRPEPDQLELTRDDALPATVEGLDSGELPVRRRDMEFAVQQDRCGTLSG